MIHTEQITDSTTSEENKQREKLTKNVGLSLGFADFATIEGGHGSSGGESKETGNKTTKKNKAMDWQIQGGDPRKLEYGNILYIFPPLDRAGTNSHLATNSW